eukprot:COSAG01_NODE_2845_length_6987_cov_19.830139_2_plen_61_part_00
MSRRVCWASAFDSRHQQIRFLRNKNAENSLAIDPLIVGQRRAPSCTAAPEPAAPALLLAS